MNPLRRFLTGSGRLPDPLRAELANEGFVILEEGLPGSVTYRHLRAPGRRANWRRDAVSGAIAITTRRLVVWTGRVKQIDVPLRHPLRQAIQVSLDKPGQICFVHHAETNPQVSGQFEVRLRTTQAERIAEFLTSN